MIILLGLSIFITSFISGVLGMAGGMILMGILGWSLTVPSAMILHGFTQAFANGIRAYLLRSSIYWKILLPYLCGLLIVFGLLSFIQIVLPKSLLFILLGLFPFISLRPPRHLRLDVTKPFHAFLCGLVISFVQIMAGASGPLLDIFYLHSPLNRLQIVATKAITQFIGHVFKIFYYSLVLNYVFQGELSFWIFPLAVTCAFTGTLLGQKTLVRLSEKKFRLYSWIVVSIIGFIYLLKGVSLIPELW